MRTKKLSSNKKGQEPVIGVLDLVWADFVYLSLVVPKLRIEDENKNVFDNFKFIAKKTFFF